MIYKLLCILLCLGTLSACTSLQKNSTKQLHQIGTASWYGKNFQGRKTASGEKFDMHQMTAAHRTLPFGTWVRVTSHSTGRTVRVRINDRGPFHKNRLIDLSYAAASALGFVSKGEDEVDLHAE